MCKRCPRTLSNKKKSLLRLNGGLTVCRLCIFFSKSETLVFTTGEIVGHLTLKFRAFRASSTVPIRSETTLLSAERRVGLSRRLRVRRNAGRTGLTGIRDWYTVDRGRFCSSRRGRR